MFGVGAVLYVAVFVWRVVFWYCCGLVFSLVVIWLVFRQLLVSCVLLFSFVGVVCV